MRNTIKTGSLILALAFVVPVVACAPTATSRSTGVYVDDATITTKVKAAILEDPALKVLDIHVATYQGEVHLTGTVGAQPLVDHAGEVAARIGGVVSVRNDLVVQ